MTLFCLAVAVATHAAAPQRSPYETGWRIHSTSAADWIPVDGKGILTRSDDCFTFFLPAHSTATWILTTEPVWVYRFSELTLRFRSHGLAHSTQRPLLSLQPGSTGPVTPGAKNMENPFARAGAKTILLSPEQLASNKIQTISVPVHPPIQTEQIDRIVLSIETAGQPGVLEIFDLSFRDPKARNRKAISLENIVPAEAKPKNDNYIFIPMPSSGLSLSDISQGFDRRSNPVQCAGIPFQWSESRSVLASSFPGRDSLTVPIERRCREVFLLLGAYLTGTDGAFSFVPRTEITFPERLIVTKHYSDGVSEQSFPYNLNRSEYVVDATPLSAYVIPADPERELERITIDERMPYGQIFVAGVTLNVGPKPIRPIRAERWPVSLPVPKETEGRPPIELTVEENRRFVLQNDFYLLEIDTEKSCELKRLVHKKTGRNLLNRPGPLFSLMAGGLPVASERVKLESHRTEARRLTLNFLVDLDESLLRASLTVAASTDSLCELSMRLENPGYTPQFIRLRFPNLQEIQIGDSVSDDYYLFPRKRAALGNSPVRLNGVHAGEFPLQFMDLYSPALGAGFAIHTRGTQQVLKRFRLEKTKVDSRMAVDYGFFKPIELGANKSFTAPTTILEFHAGDWHTPFQTYRNWLKTWYHPNPLTRNILKNVFVVRRDYPIGGTGYLFDGAKKTYTFPRLIEESTGDLGGVDLIDISGWAYSEEFGRVGEYRRYEMGGLENFKQGIELSHQQNVPVGLYTEGYLIDPRSKAGREHGTEWQLIDSKGKPKQWRGNDELFVCPFVPGWRCFLADTLLAVSVETGVDAVYVDQYGFANTDKVCYSFTHGHEPGAHPLHGEYETLKHIRETLNRSPHPVALYTEQVPNDITSQYTDAAFDYSFTGKRSYRSPAKLNLFRYAFPTFKVIQLFHPGIDPKGISAEDAKLCFFHGEAMWLKGRARSWYSRECRELIQKAYRIFHEHRNAFHSTDVEPFIPTLQPGLYANCFSSKNETVITLYNADRHTIRGPLLSIPGSDPQIEDLWGTEAFSVEKRENETLIQGALNPHAVSCLVVRMELVKN